MISSLFMLTTLGEVIVEKQFREKFSRRNLEEYWSQFVATQPVLSEVPSVVLYSRYAFIHIVRKDVILLAVATTEVSPMMIIEILQMLGDKISLYTKEISETALRENFSVVYQLLEELIDYGYPLNTEQHVLEELVPPPTLENKVRSMLDAPMAKKGKASMDFNAVPWRSSTIKYSTNEIFFDIYENVDMIVDSEGSIIRAGVHGSVETNCRLSGMPDVVLRLHGTEVFDDVSFHRCVRQNRYDADRSISFVPPDGRFTLMQYSCKPFHSLQPPFYVTPQISFNKEGGRINIMVGIRHGGITISDKEKEIHRLTINIPLPPQTENVAIQSCSHGVHSYDSQTKTLSWRIGQLGQATPSLSGEFGFGRNDVSTLVTGTGESVSVEFQIPNYAISGLRVDNVNCLNESFKPYKGVKYITRSGKFSIRTV